MSNTTSLDIDGMKPSLYGLATIAIDYSSCAQEKIEQIKLMRELIRLKEKSGDGCSSAFKKTGKKKNIISDSVMSVVFVTSFVLIVAMAVYSFRTLYLAIQKKFHSSHTEL